MWTEMEGLQWWVLKTASPQKEQLNLQLAVNAGPGKLVCNGQQVLLPEVGLCGASRCLM